MTYVWPVHPQRNNVLVTIKTVRHNQKHLRSGDLGYLIDIFDNWHIIVRRRVRCRHEITQRESWYCIEPSDKLRMPLHWMQRFRWVMQWKGSVDLNTLNMQNCFRLQNWSASTALQCFIRCWARRSIKSQSQANRLLRQRKQTNRFFK